MTVDKRKKYLIGIDTETCNGLVDENGKVDLSQSLVYDIGWQVVDKKGKVYKKRSFVADQYFFRYWRGESWVSFLKIRQK